MNIAQLGGGEIVSGKALKSLLCTRFYQTTSHEIALYPRYPSYLRFPSFVECSEPWFKITQTIKV